MTDPAEELLRKNARKLATALLRDPFLAVGYRDMVFNSWSDSNAEDLVDRWMVDAGYATRHDLLSKELKDAPHVNIAAWDGAYLTRVDQKELVVVEITAHGVRVDRRRVADASFSGGVLTFGPSRASPWAGELRFARVAPPDDRPLSDGGTFQWLCDGKLWRKEAAKPAEDNAHGMTRRVVIRPDHHPAPVNAALRAEAPLGATAGVDPPRSFLNQWAGKYEVTLISTETQPSKTDPNISVPAERYQKGPGYGVAGASDSAATLTYIAPYSCDLTTLQQPLDTNHIVYDDGIHHFDLKFATFTDRARAFSGFIYLKNADPTTIPTTPNAVGDTANSPNPPDTWSAPVMTAIGGATLIGTIIGLGLTAFAVWFSGYLATKSELHDAEESGDQAKIQAADRKISDKKIELKTVETKARSNDPQISILGDSTSREQFTTAVIKNSEASKKDLAQTHSTLEGLLKEIQEALPKLQEELKQISETRSKIEKKEIEGDLEQIKQKEDEAEREVRDLHEQASVANEALSHVEEKMETNEKEHESASEFHKGEGI